MAINIGLAKVSGACRACAWYESQIDKENESLSSAIERLHYVISLYKSGKLKKYRTGKI